MFLPRVLCRVGERSEELHDRALCSVGSRAGGGGVAGKGTGVHHRSGAARLTWFQVRGPRPGLTSTGGAARCESALSVLGRGCGYSRESSVTPPSARVAPECPAWEGQLEWADSTALSPRWLTSGTPFLTQVPLWASSSGPWVSLSSPGSWGEREGYPWEVVFD